MNARTGAASTFLLISVALVLALGPWTRVAAASSVAIIIDDIGDRLAWGRRAVALPGPVTCSFLPHTPYAAVLADAAHHTGKEVMLHLPMESINGNRLGPGGLTATMDRTELAETVLAGLRSIPHVRGFNNHMGSLLTGEPQPMDWLMEVAREYGRIYFVDSRTSRRSVAQRVAYEHGVPTLSRDVFLDNRRDRDYIRGQLAQLLAVAKQTGQAIGIGHPYPETMAVLEAAIPRLKAQGVRLVPVSAIIAERQERRYRLWQASLSPSPKVAKNSKP